MATYYVKTTGGIGSGLDDFNAWSYAKLNASIPVAGDTVLFKRGETFYGTLTVKSGIAGNVIYYGSYGNGANPVITGLTELTQWTLHSGNIYYADLDVTTLNLVMVDGVVKGMGRYPKTGWLKYESHNANTSITDTALTGTPNWTGAEVVIRKYRWIIDRHIITAHTGSTLTYNALATYGNNNAYSPVNGNGYFIQGHLGTLDTLGDWYYDNATNRLYMHFGSTGTPSGKVIKVSTVNYNVSVNSKSYITVSDLDFEGSNVCGINGNGIIGITFKNCNFRFHGGTANYAINATDFSVIGGSISDSLNNGIWIETGGVYCTVDGVRVENIGTIAGAGRSGDGAQTGVVIGGENTKIKNCKVVNTGYHGIQFNGSNALIENNFVDTFCTVKDDGAGIYSYLRAGLIVSNRIVRNNIILNAIGAFAGAEAYYYEAFGKAAGIYLDGDSNHTEVSGNIVAHGQWGGIYVNGNKDNQILNNTVYDFAQQLFLNNHASGKIRGMIITSNKFIAKTATQKAMQIRLGGAIDDPALFGAFNNNYYVRSIDDASILIDRAYSGGGGITNITLATWRSTYGEDDASSKSLPVFFPLCLILQLIKQQRLK